MRRSMIATGSPPTQMTPNSVVKGVEISDTINAARAIPACEEAVRLTRKSAASHSNSPARKPTPITRNSPSLSCEALDKDGYAIAGVYLGFLYASGTGVAKDEAEAVRLFREGCRCRRFAWGACARASLQGRKRRCQG